MAFTLSIGNLDVTNMVAEKGFQWERNDIDAPNSGRNMNGTMRRKIVTTKDKISVTCRNGLTEAELTALTTALAPQTVSVTYYCPGTASVTTKTFYGSKIQSGVVMDLGARMLFDGIQFSLIEV